MLRGARRRGPHRPPRADPPERRQARARLPPRPPRADRRGPNRARWVRSDPAPPGGGRPRPRARDPVGPRGGVLPLRGEELPRVAAVAERELQGAERGVLTRLAVRGRGPLR